ncbi:hypothetical protein N6H13_14080 [Paenibacillus sp. CC-CFT742]|nr:hypothetical protein [Paenibacillus sp. CC-CFT742]WJH31556.1 hypothetical protein N6H13_14080 [Paenibacillus sp. CC-CFT742]
MKDLEPVYLVRRLGDALIAADNSFSQFYQIEPAEELEPRLVPQLAGISPPVLPFFHWSHLLATFLLVCIFWVYLMLEVRAWRNPRSGSLNKVCGLNPGKRYYTRP